MVKVVTVVGATGAQGKGVVNAFLKNPAYQVRAITRNPSSDAGKSLAARGANVVFADLNDVESLKSAFAGSHVIFAMTNFAESFVAHQSPTKAIEVESEQGINLARAAAATSTLEHYVWSTLPNGLGISGGKFLIPHFESKNRVDAYIRDKEPDLLRKTTFFWVTFYGTNYTSPVFAPLLLPSAGKYLQFGSYAPDTPIDVIGDVSVNITPFIKAVVEQPEKTANGGIVLVSNKLVTADEMLQTWAKVKGVKAQFVQVSGEAYRDIWPLWGEEIGLMMEFWDSFRERSWTEPSGARVLGKEDLGLADTAFQGLEEAFNGLEL